MGKKVEVVNNTDVDDDNSIKSEDDNVMDNLKDLVSNLNKKDKKKKSKKKEEEIVINEEDDSEEDDTEEDDSNDEDDEDDEDDSDDEDDTDDSEDNEDDASFNNNIMALASLFQESFYDNEGVSVGESLSKIANLMEKFYNLEKKKYQSGK